MKPKHTPGPWIEDGNGFAPTWDVSSDKGSIATVTTSRADARLIAMTPNLLTTLQACKASLDAYGSADPNGVALIELIDKTLKQARGET